MHYKKKGPLNLIEAFQYTDYSSLPKELKYSKSNINGLMKINLPGKICEKCGTYSNSHVIYYKDGYPRLICPGTFIIYNHGVILEDIDYNTFVEAFEPVEVMEVNCCNEYETKDFTT